MIKNGYIYTGWWYTCPSEKYESQLGWLHSHILWKIKKCLKPPTSIISRGFIFNYWGYHWNTRQKKKHIRQAEIIITKTAHVGMISLDRAVFSKPANKGMSPTLMADPRWVPSGKHTKSNGTWQFSSLIYPAITWWFSSSLCDSLPEGNSNPSNILVFVAKKTFIRARLRNHTKKMCFFVDGPLQPIDELPQISNCGNYCYSIKKSYIYS